MRIIQICPYSWDAPGGVQSHVRQLADQLQRRGHEVLVLAPGSAASTERDVRIVGRPVRVRFNGSVVPLCFSPASATAVREALDQFDPDVVHLHEPLAPSTSMLAALYAKAPLVATFHAYFGREMLQGQMYSAVAPLLRPIWRRIDHRIAVSQAAAASVTSRMGRDPIRIVPNGADLEPFRRALPADLPAGRKLLFVGRLEPRKGFPIAVRAFALLAQRMPDVRLLVVGEGRDRKALRELDADVRARVTMLGHVTRAELPTYHAAADVFIGSALGSESFGIVLVEAMAAGLPVVVSDIAGYREVVHEGIEGLLVPPSDPEALAAALTRVLDDASLAARLGAAGEERACDFSWDTVAAQIEESYHDAVSPRSVALVAGA